VLSGSQNLVYLYQSQGPQNKPYSWFNWCIIARRQTAPEYTKLHIEVQVFLEVINTDPCPIFAMKICSNRCGRNKELTGQDFSNIKMNYKKAMHSS